MPIKMAVSYERVSSPEQLTGDGLRRQRARIENLCRENGLKYDSELSERLRASGISAYHGRNLEILLERIEDGTLPEGYAMIVEDFDRLSRLNAWDVSTYLRKIVESGIEILVCDDDDENPPMKVNRKTIAEHFPDLVQRAESAHKYSKRLGRRVHSSWEGRYQKSQSGAIKHIALTPKPPIGFKAIRKGEHRLVIIDPPMAQLIVKIFEGYVNDTSLANIAEKINAISRKPNGKQWLPTFLPKVLRNRAYIGEYHPAHLIDYGRKWKPIKNAYPRIIEQDLWDRAQAKIDATPKSKTKGRRKHNHQNLLNGIGYCSKCNSTLVVKPRGKSPNLICATKAMHWPDCESHPIYRCVAEATVLDAILSDLPLEKFQTDNGNVKRLEDEIGRLESNLERKQKELRSYAKKLRSIDDEDLEIFKEELSEIKSEIKIIEEKIGSAKYELSRSSTSLKSFKTLRNSIADLAIQAVCGVEGGVSLRIEGELKKRGKLKWFTGVKADYESMTSIPAERYREIRMKIKPLIRQVISGVFFGEENATIELANGSRIKAPILDPRIKKNHGYLMDALGGMFLSWLAQKAESKWLRNWSTVVLAERDYPDEIEVLSL